jgi:hypothetical protein
MADDTALDSFGFRNPDTAIRLKKIMQQVAAQEAGALDPTQNVARCLSVNLGKLKSDVWIPGDPEPITVNLLPGTIPNDIGDATLFGSQTGNSVKGQGSLVIVEPLNGKNYITRVLSGGQFAYDLGAAGFGQKILNTSHEVPEIWDHTPQVSGTFGKSFSFFLPSSAVATRIGPLVATGNGTTLDGVVKVHISRGYDVTSFEFELHDNQMWDSNGHQVSWMRALPKKSGRNGTDSELALDFGILSTSYRDPSGFEIWIRLVEISPSNDIDFTYVNVEAFGPVINIGDPTSGRLLVLDYVGTPTQIGGYFGFHDSNHGFRNRFDEALAVDTPYFNGTSWNSGTWDDTPTQVAQQLYKLWSSDGAFIWTGTRVRWDGNIIFSGVGPSHYGLNKGRLNVPMPAVGTKVPLYPATWTGSISSVTVLSDANGIPMEQGDTLYFGLPPGMGLGETDGTTNWHKLKWMFFIVDSATYTNLDFNYKLPQWAIPIARRGFAGEQPEFSLTSPRVNLYDFTQYRVVSQTATVTPTTTEVVMMTFNSFTFKNGHAYRFKFKTLYRSTTSTVAVRFQLRKGTTIAGADWGRTGYMGVNATNADYGHYQEFYIVNESGADITTQFVLTTIASAVGITLVADAASKRWGELEYAGPAGRYSALGVSIT